MDNRTAHWAAYTIKKRFPTEIPYAIMAIVINYMVMVEESAEQRGYERAKEQFTNPDTVLIMPQGQTAEQ